ncbi:hypothetical protein [Aeromonas caviae]
MSDHTLLPHGEDLRRAVRWLSEHHQHDMPLQGGASAGGLS